MTWIRDETRKIRFTVVIRKSDNGENCRKQFVMLRCEIRGSYTRYKKLAKCKISTSVKYNCLLQLTGYLLTVGDWSLKVWDREHNHEMTQVFQDHKFVELIRLEENRPVGELANSMVLPRYI